MAARPTAEELVEAVAEFLELEILPLLGDRRIRFRALVALNALAIARRDLTATVGDGLLDAEQLRELATAIRSGSAPAGVVDLLRTHVAAELRIVNPG